MRNQLFWAIALIMVLLTSCTQETPDTKPPYLQLIKKISYQDFSNSNFVYEINFKYNKNILISTTSGDPSQGNYITKKYYYDNKRLIKTLMFEANSDEPINGQYFAYEGKLLKTINDINGQKIEEYEYLNDVLIKKYIYIKGLSGNQTYLFEVINYETIDDNFVKESHVGVSSSQFDFNQCYKFDLSNNPFKNLDITVRKTFLIEHCSPISQNNIIEQWSLDSNNQPSPSIVLDINYDANNFPVKIIRKFTATQTIANETNIEYF